MNATWSALTAGCVSIFVSVTSGRFAVRGIGASARTIAVTTSDTYRFMMNPCSNDGRMGSVVSWRYEDYAARTEPSTITWTGGPTAASSARLAVTRAHRRLLPAS